MTKPLYDFRATFSRGDGKRHSETFGANTITDALKIVVDMASEMVKETKLVWYVIAIKEVFPNK